MNRRIYTDHHRLRSTSRVCYSPTAPTAPTASQLNFTEVFSFFFKPVFCMKSGPGMQLTTAGMPPVQDHVLLGLVNSSGQAARWTSEPEHATEWMWKVFF